MPKVSATSPPRLARKRLSQISTSIEQDADVLLRFKHTSHYRVSPTTFDAALAMCQLHAKLESEIDRLADIPRRPSKRRRISQISAPASIISNITSSSSSHISAPASPPSTPGPTCGAARPTRSNAGPQRHHITNPAYESDITITASRLSDETQGSPAVVSHKCPTIKISLESLERLRRSLHEKPAVYRVIDAHYGSKKRKRD